MYNILTDSLPQEYEGYLINWRYYTGILINCCLEDNDNLFEKSGLGEQEKIYTALTMLYGAGIPADFKLALNGLTWFLNAGDTSYTKENSETVDKTKYFDFSQDSGYIYSAFRLKYGINLAKTQDLHWFEFIYLFNDLSKTAFREIVNIRMMKPSDYKGYSQETIREIKKQKQKFALKSKNQMKNISKEEQQMIDLFYSSIKKGR